ncbi:uncharacterized protein LOC118564515 [Fundulus heteroclitus]|uniref:uncharacterized protein LOC118564515 n=1 Tax=Fundulus heteroclitus TaxID=8078 RepID=UPI00165C2365|nr:uncharacterized protein LOC118564515 [Fundulus heteroclitus]
MKTLHLQAAECFRNALLFVFAAGLQDGELGPVQAATYREMEGKNISVSCSFFLAGSTMYFCKKDCSRKNILVETTENRAQSGRYSIEFNKRGASYVVVVSITELKRSDSGWYRCALGITGILHEDFEIVVNDASEPTSLSSSPSSSSSETSQPDRSATTSASEPTSLSSSPSASSSETSQPDKSATTSGLQLYIALTLVIKIILLSIPLVIFCRKRRIAKQKTNEETEEIREGQRA